MRLTAVSSTSVLPWRTLSKEDAVSMLAQQSQQISKMRGLKGWNSSGSNKVSMLCRLFDCSRCMHASWWQNHNDRDFIQRRGMRHGLHSSMGHSPGWYQRSVSHCFGREKRLHSKPFACHPFQQVPRGPIPHPPTGLMTFGDSDQQHTAFVYPFHTQFEEIFLQRAQLCYGAWRSKLYFDWEGCRWYSRFVWGIWKMSPVPPTEKACTDWKSKCKGGHRTGCRIPSVHPLYVRFQPLHGFHLES